MEIENVVDSNAKKIWDEMPPEHYELKTVPYSVLGGIFSPKKKDITASFLKNKEGVHVQFFDTLTEDCNELFKNDLLDLWTYTDDELSA